jgi:plasmid maintenance system antidote protein VapI
MRVAWKVRILRSGRRQFEIAQQIGVSESRLPRFLRGFDVLTKEEVARLAETSASRAKVGQQ